MTSQDRDSRESLTVKKSIFFNTGREVKGANWEEAIANNQQEIESTSREDITRIRCSQMQVTAQMEVKLCG